MKRIVRPVLALFTGLLLTAASVSAQKSTEGKVTFDVLSTEDAELSLGTMEYRFRPGKARLDWMVRDLKVTEYFDLSAGKGGVLTEEKGVKSYRALTSDEFKSRIAGKVAERTELGGKTEYAGILCTNLGLSFSYGENRSGKSEVSVTDQLVSGSGVLGNIDSSIGFPMSLEMNYDGAMVRLNARSFDKAAVAASEFTLPTGVQQSK